MEQLSVVFPSRQRRWVPLPLDQNLRQIRSAAPVHAMLQDHKSGGAAAVGPGSSLWTSTVGRTTFCSCDTWIIGSMATKAFTRSHWRVAAPGMAQSTAMQALDWTELPRTSGRRVAAWDWPSHQSQTPCVNACGQLPSSYVVMRAGSVGVEGSWHVASTLANQLNLALHSPLGHHAKVSQIVFVQHLKGGLAKRRMWRGVVPKLRRC